MNMKRINNWLLNSCNNTCLVLYTSLESVPYEKVMNLIVYWFISLFKPTWFSSPQIFIILDESSGN